MFTPKGKFGWYEFMTSDTKAAGKFYSDVVGWTTQEMPITSWRIVNTPDVVPKVPPTIPFVLDYEHVDVAYTFDSSSFAKKNLGCYHSVDTYLHWLDNTIPLSPECA